MSSRVSTSPVPPDVAGLLERITAADGGNLSAVVFFGSRLLDTAPGRHSAADMFFIVEDYLRFYRDNARVLDGSSRLMAWMNRFLPPNVVYLPASDETGIKGFIISRNHFRREMGTRARDHFCQGRLCQQVRLVYHRDPDSAEETRELLHSARRRTLDWVPTYLEAPFTVEDYCRTMLRVSYAGEIRPEAPDRVEEVFKAQQGGLADLYAAVLAHGVEDGRLRRENDRFTPAAPPGPREWRRWRRYFARSKTRATLRWSKYVFTFSGWPDYIARKLERRTGMRIRLSERERRWPLLFAWPRAVRILRELRRERRKAMHSTGDES